MEKPTKYFLLLMTLHGSLLVTSTVAGAKVIALPFGLSASATVISYMLTFVVLDTIAELYGRQYSRLVINLGLIGMAVSAFYFELTIWVPPAEGWSQQAAFEAILSSSIRVWLGGWLAYMVSQYLDLWTFLRLKHVRGGKGSVTFRAWVSMLLGQLLDTAVFLTVAYYGIVPLGPVMVGQYFVKVVIATVTAPLVVIGVWIGRRWMVAAPAAAEPA